MEIVKRFEGGAVYKTDRGGKFILIINQVALMDMLDEEESQGIEAIREIEFVSEESRYEYIKDSGWL